MIATPDATGRGMLAGVRVLDFSRYIAGPYCAQMLAFFGADVIRVERLGGAEDRDVLPLGPAGMSALFTQSGTSKRALCLELKSARAGEVLGPLVASADVVVANMAPGALRRAGLDYTSLKSHRADIILATVSAYGHRGPWAERGGFDGIAQAMSGAAAMGGDPGSPRKTAAPYVDFGSGLYLAFATLAALYQRRDTGEGQHVQASLLGTGLTFLGSLLIEQAVLDARRVPSGNRSQTSAPSDIFATRDGHVLMHVVGDGLFRRVAEVLGADDWSADDPRFATDAARGDQRDVICARVAAWCATRTTDDVLTTLAAAGVPCGPVLEPAAVLDHPQVAALGSFSPLEMAGLGRVPLPDLPLEVQGRGARTPPPAVGAHTDEILGELGFDATAIAALRRDAVIG